MAVSSQDILNFLLANTGMSDSAIAAAMDMYGVTPSMMAEAVGIPTEQVQQRYEAVQPQGLFVPEPVYVPQPVYTPEPVYVAPTYVAPEPISQPTVTNQQIVDFIVANPTITDSQLAAVMQQYDVSPQQVAQATGTSIEEAVNRYEAVTQPVITPEPPQTQEASDMAITSKQIVDFLVANPGMSDAQIVAAMEQYGVSPAQMAQAVGLPEGEVISRVAATVPPGEAKLLGDTWVQPQYQVTGSGEDQQIGNIESIQTYKTSGGVNDQLPVGSTIQNYTPEGEFTGLSKTQKTESGLGEFALGAGLLFGLPSILNAGGAAAGGALGATEAATAFDLANAGIAGGASGFTAAELAAIEAAQAAGTTAAVGAAGGTGLLTGAPVITTPTTLTTATGALTPAATTAATTAATGALTPAVTTAATTALNPLVKAAIPAVTGALSSTLTPTNLSNLISGGLGTAGSLLQMQTSKEAAQKAQAMIDAETAAAKQAAQFRPVGMTTRFGTSQFQIDPTTGQITSAGYTLSPEAKAAQDRLVNLAGAGLTQAEQAQQQFAPLQTGAQRLFGLGNQYLAQSPEQVAQNYMAQQLALLQPGRELELANLQNKLQQQGRAGLSVAQGGTYGATTPELQALYNARAMQEAQLAAQAQQAGQQQVQFGAGLLGQGAGTLGQYYAGQQAAYQPYTTALGQVQALETAAQQPFTMGAQLGQTASVAGARAGALGLEGANISQRLATGANATTNPYAQLLGAAGNPNAMFGSTLNSMLGGLFSSQPATSGFSYGQYGTGVDPSTGEYFGSLYF